MCRQILDNSWTPSQNFKLYFHWGIRPLRPPQIVGLRPPWFTHDFLYKSNNQGGRRPTISGGLGAEPPSESQVIRLAQNMPGSQIRTYQQMCTFSEFRKSQIGNACIDHIYHLHVSVGGGGGGVAGFLKWQNPPPPQKKKKKKTKRISKTEQNYENETDTRRKMIAIRLINSSSTSVSNSNMKKHMITKSVGICGLAMDIP